MARKQIGRQKHTPQRTCVGCREVQSKRTLTRVVRTPDGVAIDSTGKLAGRGAYLHDRRSCWQTGLKGSLENALKTELTQEEREMLQTFAAALPDEAEQIKTTSSSGA